MSNLSKKSLYGAAIVIVIFVGIAILSVFVSQVQGQTAEPTPVVAQETAVLGEETPAVTDATPTFIEDTPTPSDWWYREFPPEKRAVYETDAARLTEIANIPKVPRPTRVYPTAAPIELVGTPAGAGVIQLGEMAPVPHGSFALGSTAWSAIVDDEIIQVFAGNYVDRPEQGIAAIFWWSRDATHQTRQMKVIEAPSQDGYLYIKDAEGTILLLGSEHGNDLRLDILSEQFEAQ